jgi:hypothetical protein
LMPQQQTSVERRARGVAPETFSRPARPRGPVVLSGVILMVLSSFGHVASAWARTAPGSAQTSAQLVQVVIGAADRTAQGTAAVKYQLVGARVFGPAPTPVLGTGTFDFSKGVGSAVLHQRSGTEDIVISPDVAYTRIPSSNASFLPKGKFWMSATLNGSEALATNFPQFILQVESVNPLLLLEEIAWGTVGAAHVRAERVGGSLSTGYEVSVDLTRALAHVTGPAASSLGFAIRSELTALGSGHTISIRIWLNALGKVVMLVASPPGAGIGTTTFRLPAFGVTVHTKTPPLSQVVDVAALTPLGERENNGGGDADGA